MSIQMLITTRIMDSSIKHNNHTIMIIASRTTIIITGKIMIKTMTNSMLTKTITKDTTMAMVMRETITNKTLLIMHTITMNTMTMISSMNSSKNMTLIQPYTIKMRLHTQAILNQNNLKSHNHKKMLKNHTITTKSKKS